MSHEKAQKAQKKKEQENSGRPFLCNGKSPSFISFVLFVPFCG
jgi:hypothetical protein